MYYVLQWHIPVLRDPHGSLYQLPQKVYVEVKKFTSLRQAICHAESVAFVNLVNNLFTPPEQYRRDIYRANLSGYKTSTMNISELARLVQEHGISVVKESTNGHEAVHARGKVII